MYNYNIYKPGVCVKLNAVVLCESSDGKPHIGRFITSRNFGIP